MPASCGSLITVGAFEPVDAYADYCPGDEIFVPNPARGPGELDGVTCKLGYFSH